MTSQAPLARSGPVGITGTGGSSTTGVTGDAAACSGLRAPMRWLEHVHRPADGIAIETRQIATCGVGATGLAEGGAVDAADTCRLRGPSLDSVRGKRDRESDGGGGRTARVPGG